MIGLWCSSRFTNISRMRMTCTWHDASRCSYNPNLLAQQRSLVASGYKTSMICLVEQHSTSGTVLRILIHIQVQILVILKITTMLNDLLSWKWLCQTPFSSQFLFLIWEFLKISFTSPLFIPESMLAFTWTAGNSCISNMSFSKLLIYEKGSSVLTPIS